MDYAVVHSGRRTIAIQIQRDGRVVVRAPYAATAEDIRRVVDSHRDWVEKTVRRQQEQLAASPPEPTAREMEELARQGREYLPRRVAYWAARMDVMPTGLQITAARTRWGSCSGKNSLCFSLFLMRYPPEAIDAVVVHELAHIRHKNHRKFQTLALVNRHHLHPILALGRQLCGRCFRLRRFHILHIADEIKQSPMAALLVLLRLFQQKPQIRLPERTPCRHTQIIIIPRFPVQQPQQLMQRKIPHLVPPMC